MTQEILHQGRVTPEDSRRAPYLYLPVEVPPGTTRLDVTLEHDPGNVIDLGLLDSRAGTFPTQAGFRGWSGGARDRFFVAMNDATPGYLPGEMPPGNWQVILGLYRIEPEGCAYRVSATVSSEPRELIEIPPEHPSFPVPAGWYPGDLQSHTHHSDAKGSPEDLIAAAKERGLRFLAVTDHNTISHHRHLARLSSEQLFLLPGEEVTTERGHANVWGARDWVDFRITEDPHVAAVVKRAHGLGGLISVNHPKAGGPAWRYEVPEGIDCVEAWQAPWPAGNDESLAFYDALLRAGRRPVLVGGSDRHQPGWPDPDPVELQVGSPTTWLWLEELSIRACLEALRSGRVFVSRDSRGPRLELSVDGVPMGGVVNTRRDPGSQRHTQQPEYSSAHLHAHVFVSTEEPLLLRLIGASGALFEAEIQPGRSQLEQKLEASGAGPFMRAELRDPQSGYVVALSNPVFLAN